MGPRRTSLSLSAWAAVCSFAVVACTDLSGTTGCFVDEWWPESSVQVFPDVQYGSAYDPATKKTLNLTLDAYFPPAADGRKARPLAVLVHGGSFETGNSQSDDEPLLARKLAARGYVAVSINYRLDGELDGLASRLPCIAATEDAKAAIRYARSVSDQYQIDPKRVAIMGDSAGAITSLYVGYASAGQHGNSGTPGVDDSVQMVVPISGMMMDQAFCEGLLPNMQPYNCALPGAGKTPFDDTKNVTGPPQPPLLMVHGTKDLTVPYVNAKKIADRATAVGLANKLITIEGAGHVPFAELWASTNFTTQFFTFLADNFADGAECPSNGFA